MKHYYMIKIDNIELSNKILFILFIIITIIIIITIFVVRMMYNCNCNDVTKKYDNKFKNQSF